MVLVKNKTHPLTLGYPSFLNVMSIIFPLTKWIGGSGDEDGLKLGLVYIDFQYNFPSQNVSERDGIVSHLVLLNRARCIRIEARFCTSQMGRIIPSL